MMVIIFNIFLVRLDMLYCWGGAMPLGFVPVLTGVAGLAGRVSDGCGVGVGRWGATHRPPRHIPEAHSLSSSQVSPLAFSRGAWVL